jgi:hypothetical protein
MALNIREESMPKYIKALGKKRVIAALSKEDMIAAMGEEEVVRLLVAKLGRERLQEMLERVSKN